MTSATTPDASTASITWPLTFDEFSFGTWAFNTLSCNIIFRGHQLALDEERNGPSGPPPSPDWKDRWSASFNVFRDMMPPGPVEVRWTSMDGVEHYAEIDLIAEIFPEQLILHDVAQEDVWEFWATDSFGHHPEILMEVNDRTITVYMKSCIMTKTWEGEGDDKRRIMRAGLFNAWSKTY